MKRFETLNELLKADLEPQYVAGLILLVGELETDYKTVDMVLDRDAPVIDQLGGHIYLVDSEYDVIEMLAEINVGSIDSIRPDVAENLDSDSNACFYFLYINNNAGGPTFVVTPNATKAVPRLLEVVPSFHGRAGD